MCPPFHLKENVLKGILKEQLTFLEEYVGTITTNESLYCKVNKVRISQSNKPPKCWVVKGAITSPNHPRENIVLRRCQDQVNTGLPLCQINFRDTVRGMLFGRKLGSHCLDGAVQLFHSFCLELRFFFKDAAICISAPRPGFVWERASVPFPSFYFFFF